MNGGWFVTSTPWRRTRPDVGSSKPAIIRSVVVLPEPDGPSIEKNSPSPISRSIPATAVTTSPTAPPTDFATRRPTSPSQRLTTWSSWTDGVAWEVTMATRSSYRVLGWRDYPVPSQAMSRTSPPARSVDSRRAQVICERRPRARRAPRSPARRDGGHGAGARRLRRAEWNAPDHPRDGGPPAGGGHRCQGLHLRARGRRPRSQRDRRPAGRERRPRGPRGGHRRRDGPGRMGARGGRAFRLAARLDAAREPRDGPRGRSLSGPVRPADRRRLDRSAGCHDASVVGRLPHPRAPCRGDD